MQVEFKVSSEKKNNISALSLELNELYVVKADPGSPPVLRLRGCDNTMYGLGHGRDGITPDDKWNTWKRADDLDHDGFYMVKKVKKLTIEVED